MGGVLIVGSVADDCAATVEALRSRGVDAVAASAPADIEAAARDRDVILADLDAAIELGWVRSSDTPPPRPLIVISRHEAFLDVVRERVAACIRAPFRIDDVIQVIQRVLDKMPPLSLARAVSPLDVPGRDQVVRRFCDGAVDPELMGIAALVARGTRSDCALIAVLDSQRQTFLGHAGLGCDLLIEGGTARDWSFCAHTIAGGERLVVGDAPGHPAFANNPLVELKLVGAYAGVPISVDGYGVVGTVCAMSQEPRTFGAADFAVLELAARVAADRMERRVDTVVIGDEAPDNERDASEIKVGDLLQDKYWVTARLASGGESDVFIARDRVVGRMVVIKWIWRRGDEPLLTEARGLSAVRHPNIVQLYDWGRTTTGRSYLILEHVEGKSLAEVIDGARARNEPLPFAQVVSVVRALAGALESMHAVGFAHGDLKPGNVIVDRSLDRPVLIDFGFSISFDSANGERESVHGGTPGFSAPEQFMARSPGAGIDARVDVYALAALAYAMIAGDAPFADVGSKDRIAAQIAERVAPISSRRKDAPHALDVALARALSSEPSDRPASVLELASEIEQAVRGVEAPPMLEPREPRSRGVAFRIFRATARRLFTDAEDARILSSLSPTERSVLEATVDDDDFLPSAPLVAYLRELSAGDRSRIEALARAVSGVVLPHAFAALGITRTPTTVLRAAEVLLHRFHDWGRVEIEWDGPGFARVRLALPPGFAPELCAYLSEVLRVLLQTTGLAAMVIETSCVARGASTCEYDVTWALA